MPRLPALNAREVAHALKRAGFVLARQRGSHAILTHERSGRVAVVPMHGGKDLQTGTLRGIVQQAGLTVEEFVKLLR